MRKANVAAGRDPAAVKRSRTPSTEVERELVSAPEAEDGREGR